MANLDFTQQDIVDLIRKLSTLQPYLTQKERALLLSIFAAAADRARSSGVSGATLPEAESSGQAQEAEGQPTIADLQQQLLSAYIPGNSFDSITGLGTTFSVTEDPASVTQSSSVIPPEPGGAETSDPAGGDTETSQPESKDN